MTAGRKRDAVLRVLRGAAGSCGASRLSWWRASSR